MKYNLLLGICLLVFVGCRMKEPRVISYSGYSGNPNGGWFEVKQLEDSSWRYVIKDSSGDVATWRVDKDGTCSVLAFGKSDEEMTVYALKFLIWHDWYISHLKNNQ